MPDSSYKKYLTGKITEVVKLGFVLSVICFLLIKAPGQTEKIMTAVAAIIGVKIYPKLNL